MNPNIIKRGALLIAGVSGDGSKTWDVWNAFERLSALHPLGNKLDENGYEIRIYDGGRHTVHVGHAVTGEDVPEGYSVFKVPASKYASFDVYVANGYDSENSAMDEWLSTNGTYAQRMLGSAHYCVEFYDERFKGEDAGSIVEIWVPIMANS